MKDTQIHIELDKLKQLKAIGVLIENSGWEEWDVSDYVEKADEYNMSFIGNETEHMNFIKQLDE